jgi:hypothetical protein
MQMDEYPRRIRRCSTIVRFVRVHGPRRPVLVWQIAGNGLQSAPHQKSSAKFRKCLLQAPPQPARGLAVYRTTVGANRFQAIRRSFGGISGKKWNIS